MDNLTLRDCVEFLFKIAEPQGQDEQRQFERVKLWLLGFVKSDEEIEQEIRKEMEDGE